MRFLHALKNENRSSPPVWLMRQAGRYLPEYKELRKKHSLLEMFLNPSLIEAVTLMPERRFGMDASILFSDILMPALSMGLSLDFESGPKISPLVCRETWEHLSWDVRHLHPIFEAIGSIKSRSKTPLIGFCGGPFTVSTYLINPEHRVAWMEEDPISYGKFLDRLAEQFIEYLQMQIKMGVDAVQIFDSWSSLLDGANWETFCLKPLEKMVKAISSPIILFMRGSGKRAEKIAAISPHAISIDWETNLLEVRKKVFLPLQGNLDPAVLLQPIHEIRAKTRKILDEMEGDPGFIFNLGHGVLPTTPVEAVEALIHEVRARS